MDKDSIILKYEQEELKNVRNGLRKLRNSNDNQEEKLEEMQEKIKTMYSLIGKEPLKAQGMSLKVMESISDYSSTASILSYDELFVKARKSLVKRGLDVEDLDYHNLVSESELKEIEDELNRTLSKREKWVKSDFVAVFIAASIGSLADIVLGDRNNKLTGSGSSFAEQLNRLYDHASGAPIDYQGKGFGGGYHRGLSRGHDVLRFLEGILMFKNGQFIGIRHEDGQAIKVISSINQYGTPYEQLSSIEAIVRYAQHMFADLLSTCSLPFPGSSFLAECDNRQLRVFAADMYKNGFNCKNIIMQSVSTIAIESIIRIYYSVQSVKKHQCGVELAEDYSNLDAFNQFFKPVNKEKLNEMLLVGHAITTAVNVGKIIIKKAPWEVNVTEIIAVVKYGFRVLKSAMARNSGYAKLIRNADEIHQRWQELEGIICYDEYAAREMTEILVIE